MKVLLVNGSPHKEGCTYTALSEVGKALEEAGLAAGVPLPEQETISFTNFIRD